MKKRMTIVLLVVAIIATLVSGCGTQAEGPAQGTPDSNVAAASSGGSAAADSAAPVKHKQIRFLTDWNTELERYDEFHKRLNDWLAANPDMDVAVEVALDPENKNKMKVEVASGQPADVFKWWVTPSNCTFLYEGGIAMETDKIIEASDYLTPEMFDQESRKTGTYKGVSYGLPIYGSSGFFVINKALYDKYQVPIPVTYADFREGAKTFIKNGIIPFATGSKEGNPSHYWMSALWAQWPGALDELNAIASGATLAPASGNALKTAQIIAEDTKLNMYPRDPVANGVDQTLAMFLEGRAAAYYIMSYQLNGLTAEQAANIEFVPVPKVEGGELDTSKYYYKSPTNGYQMSSIGFKDEAKRPAMIKLMDFLCSPAILELYATTEEMLINIPFDASTYSDAKKKMEAFKEGKQTYSSVQFTRIANATVWTQYKVKIDELYAGMITPEEFQKGIGEVWEANK